VRRRTARGGKKMFVRVRRRRVSIVGGGVRGWGWGLVVRCRCRCSW